MFNRKTIVSLTGAFGLAAAMNGGTSVEAYAISEATCHPSETPVQSGKATYYGDGTDGFAGRRTKSGEIMDPRKMTAASNSFAMGTYVQVVKRDRHGQELDAVIVKINDTGGFRQPRIIDLSFGAAKELNMVNAGVVAVTIHPCRPS